MGKILKLFPLLLVLITVYVIVYTNVVNVEHIDPKGDHHKITSTEHRFSQHMSESQILDMLLVDVEHINLFLDSIQKIPKEIAMIMSFQKFKLEEINIIQNSIINNCPELYGMAVAFEPFAFKNDKKYFSSYLFRKDGSILKTDLDDPEYDYFTQNWYLLAKILQKPVWTFPYYDQGAGNTFMTTYAAPFNYFDGKKETFSGVVTIDVSIEWLVHHFPRYKTLPNNGIVTLIAEDGTILSSRNEKWIINETIFSLSETLDLPELRSIGRAIQRGEHGVRKLYSTLYKKNINFYYTAIQADRWGLMYLIPEAPLITMNEG